MSLIRCDIITLFPSLFGPFLEIGMVGRALKGGQLVVNLIDLREFGEGIHRSVDDRPYGGGPGMVMMPGPIMKAVRATEVGLNSIVVITTPSGELFDQAMAKRLTKYQQIIIVCGRYEGIDQRVVKLTNGLEISIGDYVLSGGELPAMVIVDAIARLLPGVLGDESSAIEESFSEGLLEYPQYTRPRVFEGLEVPEILLSGNHKEISDWRRAQSIIRTQVRRPDLFKKLSLSKKDQELLERYQAV